MVKPRIEATRKAATGVAVCVATLAAVALGLVFVDAHQSSARESLRLQRLGRSIAGISWTDALQVAMARMDWPMLTLAQRFDPQRGDPFAPQAIAPAPGQSEPPPNAILSLSPAEAFRINAAMPFAPGPNPAARPFLLRAGAPLDEARAVECLTTAIYYEAGFESLEGRQAVAQVVLNRLRHPAFPKSVCGVVFEGSDLPTGCQFSFTCDGSLKRRPAEWAWKEAERVAVRALKGFVMAEVGNATHYHTQWVVPYWAPRLLKVRVIGAHIFYRWTGGWGLPGAFGLQYAGNEFTPEALTTAGLTKVALETGPAEQEIASTIELVSSAPGAAAPQVEPEPPEPIALAKPSALAAGAALNPVVPTLQAAPPTPARAPRLAVPNGW